MIISGCYDNVSYSVTNNTDLDITIFYTSTDENFYSSTKDNTASAKKKFSNIIVIPPREEEIINIASSGSFQVIFGGIIKEYTVQYYDHNESLSIRPERFYSEIP